MLLLLLLIRIVSLLIMMCSLSRGRQWSVGSVCPTLVLQMLNYKRRLRRMIGRLVRLLWHIVMAVLVSSVGLRILILSVRLILVLIARVPILGLRVRRTCRHRCRLLIRMLLLLYVMVVRYSAAIIILISRLQCRRRRVMRSMVGCTRTSVRLICIMLTRRSVCIRKRACRGCVLSMR